MEFKMGNSQLKNLLSKMQVPSTNQMVMPAISSIYTHKQSRSSRKRPGTNMNTML
jgi:hypothetical protein